MTIREQNFMKAKKWAHRLKKLPGVKAIYLSGSLATKTDNENSDIDFFIISYSGQIFTARFFINVFLIFSGNLAKPINHAGMICPNHFVSDDNLSLSERNKYSAKMFSCNIPLADPHHTWYSFMKSNTWIDKLGYKWKHTVNIKNIERKINLNFFERGLEKILKYLQIQKIRQNRNFDLCERIVLTDTELRFHPILKSKNN